MSLILMTWAGFANAQTERIRPAQRDSKVQTRFSLDSRSVEVRADGTVLIDGQVVRSSGRAMGGVAGVGGSGSPARFDETWTFSVAGQAVQPNPDGSFTIANIPAPDNNRGSISDNCLRVVGVSSAFGPTRYAVSEPFQISTGQTYLVSDLVLTGTPPRDVESLMAAPLIPTLTIGASTSIDVTATFTDGSTGPPPTGAGTCGVTYRSSNPAIATIDASGNITGVGVGIAAITVTLQGATGVTRVAVTTADDPLTTLEGFVQRENGMPAGGAVVTLLEQFAGLGSAVTDGTGHFEISGLPTTSELGDISVRAEFVVGKQTLIGVALDLSPVPGGITDAGIIVRNNDVIWIASGDGFWDVGTNWSTGAPPGDGADVIIDRPGVDVTVTHRLGTSLPNSIQSTETILLIGGTLAPVMASTTNLTQSGGTIGGTGTVDVLGTLTWTGGTMTDMGTTTVAAIGTLQIDGAGTKVLRSGRQLNNAGVGGTWSGTGNIRLQGGAAFNNLATDEFTIQNNQSFEIGISCCCGSPGASVSNAGLLIKDGGGTTNTTCWIGFVNSGTVDVQSGLLSVFNSFTQTAGATILSGGDIQSSTALDIQGGILSGDGTVTAAVTTAGTTSPGFSTGTLNVTGNYTETAAAAALNVEIGGLVAGTDFDQLNVTTQSTLAGTLNISVINGFTPMLGDTFTILTYGSRIGSFAVFNGLSIGPGLAFQPVFDTIVPNSLTLEVVVVP